MEDTPSKPFYRRWWFYVLLGVGSAAIGAGITYALTRSDRPAGPGVTVFKPIVKW